MARFVGVLVVSAWGVLVSPAWGQAVTNYVIVVNDTNSPVNTSAGSISEAQSYFLDGLEYGSGLAAILFGFISVRRALSIGDSWND